MRFSHPITGRFVWPKLRRLALHDTDCEGDEITAFLEAHKDSLCDLTLQYVDLDTGSWQSPFNTLLSMPKLNHAVLVDLKETMRPTQSRSFVRLYCSSPWVPRHHKSLHDPFRPF